MTFDLNLNSMSLGNELITSGKRICKTYVKERKKTTNKSTYFEKNKG